MLSLMLAVSLGMAPTPLPVDTLRVDSTVLLGVAVPTKVQYIQGDINYDGSVTLSDVLSLAYYVLMARPLPDRGDTLGIQLRSVTVPTDSLTPADTTFYLFIPTKGIKR